MQLDAAFLEMMHSLGLGDVARALTDTPAVTAVRLNPLKAVPVGLTDGAAPVPWCPEGFILPERPDFTLDPAMHQGRYYVQEPSSMFVGHVLRSLGLTAPVLALDLCAAPGGKTQAALDALPEGSLMVANEFVASRAEVLAENMAKWGRPGVIVTSGDTSPLSKALKGRVDVVIADVPCSGEGMMRKSAEARAQWSRQLVEECAALQRDIISNGWRALRPGGYMVYSTCTFNRLENEENLLWAVENLGAEPVAVPVEAGWGITPAIGTDLTACRFLPGRMGGEGLFMALLRKPGSDKPSAVDTSLTTLTDKESRRVIPAGLLPVLKTLERVKGVRLLSAGIRTAELKGRNMVPAHPLALNACGLPLGVPAVEVDTATALSYLRRETLSLPDAPRGHVALTWQGVPLGFVNNLGTRANNLYPQHWRIRK